MKYGFGGHFKILPTGSREVLDLIVELFPNQEATKEYNKKVPRELRELLAQIKGGRCSDTIRKS